MKLKRICLLCLGVLLFLLLSEISCISGSGSGYSHDKNVITEDERRAAENDLQSTINSHYNDPVKSEAKKRGLYPAKGISSHSHFYPSGFGGTEAAEEGAGTFSGPAFSYGTPSGGHHYDHGYSGGFPSGQGGSSAFGGSFGGHTHPHVVPYGGGYPSGHGGLGGHGGGHSHYGLKSLLIPLAGIALLGAAAALSTNPVLLQLGVINGRKRRRRSVDLRQSNYSQTYPQNPHVTPDNAV